MIKAKKECVSNPVEKSPRHLEITFENIPYENALHPKYASNHLEKK